MFVKRFKRRKACFLIVELLCLGEFLLIIAEIFRGKLHVPELIAAFSNETLACFVFAAALRGLKRNGHFRCFAVSVFMLALTMVSFFLQLFWQILRLKSCFFTSFAADFPFITTLANMTRMRNLFGKTSSILMIQLPRPKILSKSERMPR